MIKKYGFIGNCASIDIRYGQENNIENVWKDIINIEDNNERKEKIAKLVLQMNNNSETNGFWGKNDTVQINKTGNAFLIDDDSIYYLFFDILKSYCEENKKNNLGISDGAIIFQAIKATVDSYFGKGSNRRKRLLLTDCDMTDEGLIVPSISKMKNENCALCVERASVAHNLWLIAGKASYYVNSLNVKFTGIDTEYKNDTHAFTIIDYNKRFKLFDMTMNNFCAWPEGYNPIETMLEGKPLEVKSGNSVQNPGIYANADKVRESEN